MRLFPLNPVFMRLCSNWPKTNLWFYPHSSKKGSRFETFREDWWLLDPELKETRGEPSPAQPVKGWVSDPSRPSEKLEACALRSFRTKPRRAALAPTGSKTRSHTLLTQKAKPHARAQGLVSS